MAISKSAKARQTDLKINDVFEKLNEIAGKLTKTAFSEIIDTTKQSVGRRMGYKGLLHFDEAALILKYLTNEGYTNNELYNDLSQIVNPVKSKHELKEIVSNTDDEDFAELPVRGDVSVSCGYGVSVYNDNATGTCRVSKSTLRQYGASITSTEIVYAQGDSMSPEIESGDALLVDTSQTEITNGIVYAFNYDGQPMCKRLQKIGNEIKAISKNPVYDPFIIDFDLQFNIVGRVVGIMRPIL